MLSERSGVGLFRGGPGRRRSRDGRAWMRWLITTVVACVSLSGPAAAGWESSGMAGAGEPVAVIDVVERGVWLHHAGSAKEAPTVLHALHLEMPDGRRLRAAPAGGEKARGAQRNPGSFYPFPDSRPARLRLIPERPSAGTVMVYHDRIPVIDPSPLTGTATLVLDWNDPWDSHFTDPALTRHHKEPVMAFLYLEPQRVRAEFIVRLEELIQWMGPGSALADVREWTTERFERMRAAIGRFVLQRTVVAAAGVPLELVLERVETVRIGPEGLQSTVLRPGQRPKSTLIGVSAVASVPVLPQTVSLRWSLFSDRIAEVAVRAFDPVGVFDSYVTAEHPLFEWENQLSEYDTAGMVEGDAIVPVRAPASDITGTADSRRRLAAGACLALVLSLLAWQRLARRRLSPRLFLAAAALLLAGAAVVSPSLGAHRDRRAVATLQPKRVIHRLLENIYRAFARRSEAAVYDGLALSVGGELLDEIYLQNRQALLLHGDGTARSMVEGVEVLDLQPLEAAGSDGALTFDCRWSAHGSVVHWGHAHRRENHYHASIRIEPVAGMWKVVGLSLHDQRRHRSGAMVDRRRTAGNTPGSQKNVTALAPMGSLFRKAP